MPLSPLIQFLNDIHEQLRTYFTDDAVFSVDAYLACLAADPANLWRRLAPTTKTAPRHRMDLPMTYFRMSVGLEVVDVSPPLMELLEVASLADLQEQRWEQYLEPAAVTRLWEHWLAAAQLHSGFTHQCEFRTPTGRRLVLKLDVLPLRHGETLAFQGWFGFVRAISKVIRIDEPLRTPRTLTPESDQRDGTNAG